MGSFQMCYQSVGGVLTGAMRLKTRTTSGLLPSTTKRLVSMRRSAATRSARAKEVVETDPSVDQKAKALDSVLKEINNKFGKGSIMQLGATPARVETIPSGALTLDIALGGGFPKGRIIEVYGPESSGKTTLAMHAIAAVQRAGGVAALIDAEHAFDPTYSERAGVDVAKIMLCQPDSGEMALEVVDQLVRSQAVNIIAVDSVAALIPRAEIEGEIGLVTVGAQARLMSQALRKLTANAAKCNCTVIFLNQIRHKIGVIYGSPEITSGGNALKFYASVRLDVRRKETISGAKGEQIGIKVKAKVVKNKCAPPYHTAEFDILFGSGISTLGCLLDAAETVGTVTRKGSYYYFGEERLGQGRDKALATLTEKPEMATEIEAKTRAILAEDSSFDVSPVAKVADDEIDLDDLDLEDPDLVAEEEAVA